ncbi:hypothetical protein L195_g023125 [Trifolium pratense]|uniref:DUF4408 domain-containing protein n=1 Tax=Trifolium pratense TaxID=57577 RepID=A0A2K3NA17_TRIPR|nr:hypothetical protein L195_g023125 [Trifolium pratense]
MEDPIAAGSNNNFIAMANWFAPSPLFIFVNLVIGTIALVTRFNAKPPKKQFQQQLFQRVKSFNLNHYNQNQPKSSESDQCESTQSQLVQKQKPSLLQRVVSFKHEPTQPKTKTHYAQAESEHPWMKPVKLEPVKLKPVCDEEDENSKVEMMKRSASEKECSMTFDWEEEEDEEMVERRRPATAMARSETTMCKEDEGVDSKADDFINMFKKQLRLQRLDSFIRYRNTL